MKKTHLICLGFILASFGVVAQSSSPSNADKRSTTQTFTALKPADATPAVFSSEVQLKEKKQAKINATLDLLQQNKDNPEQVKVLREQLWRFENAVVAPSSK